MRRWARIIFRLLAAAVVLLLVAAFAAFLIFQSGWFREKVRERIVTEVEQKTGGRVELGQFDFDATHLAAHVSPFILHGKEGVGEPPLIRIPSLTVGLRVISALERQVDLATLIVQKPEVRIV